ncbi:non-heme iron oxygenase ferredoxin subunit [Pusillimonas caeni]|uniref:non-heme iron oxygenase ferredoxin subunit n=1 Tax=Pusillimonas caeni TaxID=1348472 RepID=UPI000E59DFBC|nr:non-heme iron oxygenase ferredoxin subunit [Pusillimonas caeni]TFL08840.1 non-heme iron oxygenase ferredoxin subunit [Pusillimonas caeni]
MSSEEIGTEWERVALAEDVMDDDVLGVQAAGKAVALYKVDGRFYATHGICSHEYAHLADGFLEGCEIECPLHQARFDIRTGQAMCSPATEGIAVYPVKVVGNEVFVKV